MDATSADIRTAAHQLIDTLPRDSSWDDVMYHVYVRQCIEAGMDDANQNRVVDVDEVRKQFGLGR
jgi:hypothetical protein